MAVTFTLGGVAKSVALGSLHISKRLNNRHTLSARHVDRTGAFTPAIGQAVVVSEGAVDVFAGTVDQFSRVMYPENLARETAYDISAVSWEQRLDKRLAYQQATQTVPVYSRNFTFTADATTNTLTATAHGRSNGDVVRVKAYTGATLPAPLAANTDYYVVSAAANTLQLSLTSGGAAIDLTTAGSGTLKLITYRAGEAVIDLITNVANNEGITNADIDLGAVIDKAVFGADGIIPTVSEALDELAKLSNYVWFIDTAKGMHFVARSVDAAPFSLGDATANYRNIEVRSTREDVSNTIMSRPMWTAFGVTEETFVGNGSVRAWALAKRIARIEYIQVDGIDQEFGAEGVDSGKAFYYALHETGITQDPAETVLSASNTLLVGYRQLGTDVVIAEDAANIAARVTAEGGSGHYERAVDRPNQPGAVQALAEAQALVTIYKADAREVTYETDQRIEATAKNLRPGQLQTIANTFLGLSGSWLIQQIDITGEVGGPLSEPTAGNFLSYRVSALDGSRLGGYLEYFQQLASGGGSSSVSGGSGSVGGGGSTSLGNALVPVEDYGAKGDGTTDDTTAIQAAINDLKGTFKTLWMSKTYKVTAAITIDTGDFTIAGGGTIKLVTAGSVHAFHIIPAGGTDVSSTTSTTSLPKSARATAVTQTIGVASVTGLAALDYLRFNFSDGTDIFTEVTRIKSIAALNVTLEDPIVIPLLTTETGNVVKVRMVFRLTVKDLTFDGSGSSGATDTRAILANHCADCLFQDITIKDFTGGATTAGGLWSYFGYNNTYRRIVLVNSGSTSQSDFHCQGQTKFHIESITSERSGVGPQIQYSVLGNFSDIKSVNSLGRGVKLHGNAYLRGRGIVSTNNTYSGLAITGGSYNNYIEGIVTLNNPVDNGVWFSGQGNTHNTLVGIESYGNLGYDVSLAPTDSDNVLLGVRAGRLTDSYDRIFDNGERNVIQKVQDGTGFYTVNSYMWVGRKAPGTAFVGNVLPDANTGNEHLILGDTNFNSSIGEFTAAGFAAGGAAIVGAFQFANYKLTVTDKRVAAIYSYTDGAENTGSLQFWIWTAGSGANKLTLTGSALVPATLGGLALGSSALPFVDVYATNYRIFDFANAGGSRGVHIMRAAASGTGAGSFQYIEFLDVASAQIFKLNVVSGGANSYYGQLRGHFFPSVNETYDVGSTSLRWWEIFVHRININAGGVVTGHLEPSVDATYDLGASLKWRTLYLATSLVHGAVTRIDSSGNGDFASVKIGGVTRLSSAGVITGSQFVLDSGQSINSGGNFTGTWYPSADLTYSLGTASFQWLNVFCSAIKIGGLTVVSSRQGGWTAPTGTATKTGFATSTVTLPILAEHVKALIDDLIGGHGLIGP